MSRYIDADALIEDVRKRPYIGKELSEIFETIIDEQSTAYDVEKVEDALKNHPNVFQEFKGFYIPLENAVEVVESNDGKGWWNDYKKPR